MHNGEETASSLSSSHSPPKHTREESLALDTSSIRRLTQVTRSFEIKYKHAKEGMNLELVDPFGRSIPDRIDATLQLPESLHFRNHEIKKKKKGNEEEEWKAAYHVAFNRRGTYLAVGYGSGTVAVFNILCRSLSALYQSDDPTISPENFGEGITSVTWSRRSRSLLAGAVGEKQVVLYDATHPFGPEECCKGLSVASPDGDLDGNDDNESPRHKKDGGKSQILRGHPIELTHNTSFADTNTTTTFSSDKRTLKIVEIPMGSAIEPEVVRSDDPKFPGYNLKSHPSVAFSFQEPLGGSLQVSPRIPTGGLAVLASGKLVLFWFHKSSFMSGDACPTPSVHIIPLLDDPATLITCAAFDHHGDRVYAASRDGKLLGFEVSGIWKVIHVAYQTGFRCEVPNVQPTFKIAAGGASAWHLLVSRNGKYLVVNSADGTLKLFSTQELWEKLTETPKPAFIFQDVVSKVKFACCDLSGDGEYVVGGANGDDNRYTMYIWNGRTGVLMDKLTGPSVQLYSVAWHPTRSFIAAATSDGLIDIWGPRINWTAFAPDFQALPMNVEYVEREDEFDVDEQGRYLTEVEKEDGEDDNEGAPVDVTTVEKVPVFASDSEEEEEVFNYEVKVVSVVSDRGRRKTLEE